MLAKDTDLMVAEQDNGMATCRMLHGRVAENFAVALMLSETCWI